MQPAFIMAEQQSQQAWIMAQQSLSPLVQVMTQPSVVISHLQAHMEKLQQQTIMPFIIMQQEHMPPASMLQRFCIIAHDILSSQVQVIFIPPAHFSIFIVQRGTIIMFTPLGMAAGAPIMEARARHRPCPSRFRSVHHHRVGHRRLPVSWWVLAESPARAQMVGPSTGDIIHETAMISRGNQSKIFLPIMGIMIKIPRIVRIEGGSSGGADSRGGTELIACAGRVQENLRRKVIA